MKNCNLTSEWEHCNPVHIAAGTGIIAKLNKFVPHNGTILLVTTAGSTKRGLTSDVRAQLGKNRVLVYDRITPNPELDDLDYTTTQFCKESIVCIVALGGGSALDAGKVLSVTMKSEIHNPLSKILRDGLNHQWTARLPVVAIPTTSGTGAEVTPFSTVWDNQTHKKYSVSGEIVYPTHALLDPRLTLTLPRKETLYTALDAVSHALESLWNKNRTPVSEIYAMQALSLAHEALPVILENLHNLEQRYKMQQASLFAGLAISQTRTAIAHSISYPLTSHFGVPHGLACSFMLPALLKNYMEVLSGHIHNRGLLMKILNLLDGLNLKKELLQYVSDEQILSVNGEMFTNGRADNFAYRFGSDCLIRTLDSCNDNKQNRESSSVRH
jgi:alcohol dehydrogenase